MYMFNICLSTLIVTYVPIYSVHLYGKYNFPSRLFSYGCSVGQTNSTTLIIIKKKSKVTVVLLLAFVCYALDRIEHNTSRVRRRLINLNILLYLQ